MLYGVPLLPQDLRYLTETTAFIVISLKCEFYAFLISRLPDISRNCCCISSQDLNHKPRKQIEYGMSEIEDIIWEVDEDANGWIDW
jgi:hypothetical protein